MRRYAFLCAVALLFYLLSLFIPAQRLESAVGRVKQEHVVLMEYADVFGVMDAAGSESRMPTT